MEPSKFQKDCIEFVLTSYPLLTLLEQIPNLETNSIEHTGVGCFYNYKIEATGKFDPENFDTILEGGFQVIIEGLPNGALLTLRIEKGKIACLEVFAIGANFPIEDPQSYSFNIVPVNIIRDDS